MNTSLSLKSILFSLLSLSLAIAASGCSSHIPPEIREAPADSASVDQVRADPDAYTARRVRWGGVIIDIEHKQDASWLTVVALPLYDDGEPRSSDRSPGRFIAVVDRFLEPLVYKKDREITVTGKLSGSEIRKVGEFDYSYPRVQVEQHYLWPVVIEPDPYDYPPYWYYNPYYPWHPYYFPNRYYR